MYDVKFAGVSLVENYRSAFGAEIQRSGVDGLIKALAEKKSRTCREKQGDGTDLVLGVVTNLKEDLCGEYC